MRTARTYRRRRVGHLLGQRDGLSSPNVPGETDGSMTRTELVGWERELAALTGWWLTAALDGCLCRTLSGRAGHQSPCSFIPDG